MTEAPREKFDQTPIQRRAPISIIPHDDRGRKAIHPSRGCLVRRQNAALLREELLLDQRYVDSRQCPTFLHLTHHGPKPSDVSTDLAKGQWTQLPTLRIERHLALPAAVRG